MVLVGTKKRAASGRLAAAEHGGDEVPAKKIKAVKKGTAMVSKKPNAKPCAGSEAEDTISEDEDEAPTKPKAKGKSDVTAAKRRAKAAAKATGSAKAKKGKADAAAKAEQIPIHEDRGANDDMDVEYGHHDRMIDMQFDEAA